jgi:signal transduction histidine kinase
MINQNIFLELSKKVQNLGFKQSLKEISMIAIDEMKINRVSVWTFAENNTIVCNFKIDETGEKFEKNTIIHLDKYPFYFQILISEKIVIASNVYTNNSTFEIKDYFEANNIFSTLDIPIFVDGILYGIVCFENVNDVHHWTQEDVRFGTDVSQIISIAYISSKRNEDLKKLNDYAERIKTFNEELQAVIKLKNDQFIEYGFINSHLLNAPLSRLKGLMNILVLELNGDRRDDEIRFIVDKIYEAYDEMDKVVKQISVLIDKGVDIDRDDIVTD